MTLGGGGGSGGIPGIIGGNIPGGGGTGGIKGIRGGALIVFTFEISFSKLKFKITCEKKKNVAEVITETSLHQSYSSTF